MVMLSKAVLGVGRAVSAISSTTSRSSCCRAAVAIMYVTKMDRMTPLFRAILFVLLTLAACYAQPASNTKLDSLIDTIRAEVHPRDAMERVRRIYSTGADAISPFSPFGTSIPGVAPC
jgi:hypothetical protein